MRIGCDTSINRLTTIVGRQDAVKLLAMVFVALFFFDVFVVRNISGAHFKSVQTLPVCVNLQDGHVYRVRKNYSIYEEVLEVQIH